MILLHIACLGMGVGGACFLYVGVMGGWWFLMAVGAVLLVSAFGVFRASVQ